MSNSIFWENTAVNSGPVAVTLRAEQTFADSIIDLGCPTASTCSNIITADPQLGDLADNGGFTLSSLPGASGSAIDSVLGVVCPPTDQRGIPRPQGLDCDLGAVELTVAEADLIFKYGFEDLNLHRIWLRVFETNQRAIRSYDKAGFTLEGKFREAQYRDGKYVDVMIMSMLKSEWQAHQ